MGKRLKELPDVEVYDEKDPLEGWELRLYFETYKKTGLAQSFFGGGNIPDSWETTKHRDFLRGDLFDPQGNCRRSFLSKSGLSRFPQELNVMTFKGLGAKVFEHNIPRKK